MEQVQSSIKKATFQIKKRTQSFGEVDGTTAGFSGVQTKANNWDQRKIKLARKGKGRGWYNGGMLSNKARLSKGFNLQSF